VAHRPAVQRFSYDALEAATGGFAADSKIEEGGFGSVYRGTLHGTPVAVKVLAPSGMQGPEQFSRKVAVLTKMHRLHILALLGSCPDRFCLVYQLIENGNLEQALAGG
jgi:serine/threonine protein kinase